MKDIKVLIYEQQELIAKTTKSVLENQTDIAVISIANNLADVYANIKIIKPDIIIFDIQFDYNLKLKFINYIKKTYKDIKLLIITSITEEKHIAKVLNLGVDGYFLKDMMTDKIIESIRELKKSKKIIDNKVLNILLEKILKDECIKDNNINFSYREYEIIELLLKKLSNREIAKLLNLSSGTVKNYITSIYSKLGVKNRVQAIETLNNINY
ncbi:MAG: response regulator transcription factor [Peptostreptococcaceae bacterium]|nr:response regulator transcription factor [Peptostreptococcaceae bacterium]